MILIVAVWLFFMGKLVGPEGGPRRLGLDIFLFNTCDKVTGHPSSLSMEDSQSSAAFGLRRFVKVVRDVSVYKTLFFVVSDVKFHRRVH